MNIADTVINSIAVSGNNIFIGTGIGVFLSNNNGAAWSAKNNGLTSVHISAMAISGNKIYAGSRGRGLYLSTDNGNNWNSVITGTGLDLAPAVYSIAFSGNNIFAGSYGEGGFYSNNNGGTWNAMNIADTVINSIAVSGNNIFIATNSFGGVFVSTDNGLHWTVMNNGLNNHNVFSLAVSGTNIYAGTDEGGIYLSTDNGSNWTTMNSDLPLTMVGLLTISKNNLYAGLIGSGIYLSGNDGSNWTVLNNGLADNTVYSLAAFGNNVIAGIYHGVYLSTDNGSSWISVNDGLPNNNPVYAISISETDIYAGTWGYGVWKRPLSELGIITGIGKKENDNVTIYPNPVNKELYINGLDQTSKVTIYDFRGNKIYSKQLKDNQVDVSNLVKGIYMIKFESNTGISTRRFVKQ